MHQRTPTLLVNDSRDLAVRQVDYLRKIAGGPYNHSSPAKCMTVPGA